MLNATLTPSQVGSKDNLGISAGAEGEAVMLQLLSQLEVVVHLTVIGDGAILHRHRLVRSTREIDDAQAIVSEHDRSGRPRTRVIRTAVRRDREHGLTDRQDFVRRTYRVDYGNKSTHIWLRR